MKSFSFTISLSFLQQTLSFLNENGFQINENESDITLGYITLNISQNEIPLIKDFLQEIQY